MKLSSCRSERQAIQSLTEAYDGGIRWFDTAPLYGQGYSELILGKFLGRLSATDKSEVQVATKFGLGPIESSRIPPFVALPLNALRKKVMDKPSVSKETSGLTRFHPMSRRAISLHYLEKQFEASLTRLGLERVTAYLGHECLPSFIDYNAMKFLERMKKSGRIQLLGIGTSAENILHAEREDYSLFELLQYNAEDDALTKALLKKFPDIQHNHHSILKAAVSSGLNPSNKIKRHKQLYPNCRILFSSIQAGNIKQNIHAFY